VSSKKKREEGLERNSKKKRNKGVLSGKIALPELTGEGHGRKAVGEGSTPRSERSLKGDSLQIGRLLLQRELVSI